MSTQDTTGQNPAPRSLASADLPERVRKTLEIALSMVYEELDTPLGLLLAEFEQELFRLAGQAGSQVLQSGYMQTLRTFRLSRADLVPHFMLSLEAGLAGIRSAPAAAVVVETKSLNFSNLSLVETSVVDEGMILREIGSRQEGRAKLALHLLGQRFGVLAESPGLESERIPLGPQALCRSIRMAANALELEYESRLLLYGIFDRIVMANYASTLERLDQRLAATGILPGLTYVPLRLRPTAIAPDDAGRDASSAGARAVGSRPAARTAGGQESGGGELDNDASTAANGADEDASGDAPTGARTGRPGGPLGRGLGIAKRLGEHEGLLPPGASFPASADAWGQEPNRPHTAWMGEPIQGIDQNELAAIETLQHLLSGRRDLLDKLRVGNTQAPPQPLPTVELLKALGSLQAQPAGTPGTPQTLTDVKQVLLAQARQQMGHGANLSQQDSDTFELLSMLYANLEEEIRVDMPAAGLVKRLQVPLLRAALKDQSFFVRQRHPARQLLNTVAENAARWLDDADFDPQLLVPLQKAVEYVIEHYEGDAKVFSDGNALLQKHLADQVRKAELLEKRHTEAAKGREKLEIAKLRASEVVDAVVGETRLPKFTRALLNQAWADVLTLTLLRHDESSEEWNKQLDATRRIVATCARDEPGDDPALQAHVEASLALVGYHGEEATVIAQRLTSNKIDDDNDPASRTELAMKLKTRTRLGEDAAKARPRLPPRTPEEQARYDQLRVSPFGIWIEFVTTERGDVVRRRLSWFSPITGNALFLNQRGQRAGEYSLDTLARMMAAGQARIVNADRGRLVDRAWQATMNALRSFAGRSDTGGSGSSGTAQENA
ncbi:DUF1631 family protein [Luteimonas sp. RIT-PG2_3]